jgi:hypothetical protein
MKTLDRNHNIVEDQVIDLSTGNPVPSDEPVILLRGNNRLIIPLLRHYRELCVQDGCSEEQLKAIDGAIPPFTQFMNDHRDRMRQPGSQLGKEAHKEPTHPEDPPLVKQTPPAPGTPTPTTPPARPGAPTPLTPSTSGATSGAYVVSGMIGGPAEAGVVVTLDGGAKPPTTATTNAAGAYSFPGVSNGSYKVTPSKSGFAFTPTSQSVSVNGANAVAPSFSSAATSAATPVK